MWAVVPVTASTRPLMLEITVTAYGDPPTPDPSARGGAGGGTVERASVSAYSRVPQRPTRVAPGSSPSRRRPVPRVRLRATHDRWRARERRRRPRAAAAPRVRGRG